MKITESDLSMFAYPTEKESFFAATNASVTIRYQDLRRRDQDAPHIKLLGATLHVRSRDEAKGSDQHLFDDHLHHVEGTNATTQEPADPRFATEIFREVVDDVTARHAQEENPHKRLTAEDIFILDTVRDTLAVKNPALSV